MIDSEAPDSRRFGKCVIQLSVPVDALGPGRPAYARVGSWEAPIFFHVGVVGRGNVPIPAMLDVFLLFAMLWLVKALCAIEKCTRRLDPRRYFVRVEVLKIR